MSESHESNIANLPSEAKARKSELAPRTPPPEDRLDPAEIYGLYQQTPAILGVTFHEVLEVFKRRYHYLLLGAAVGIGLAVLTIFLTSPLYAVSAQVVITKQAPGELSDSDSGSSAFVATQAEVLHSPRVVEAAVATLPRPSYLNPDDDPVTSALESVNASAITGTRVVALGYLGPDPGYGVSLLNAMVAIYLSEVRDSTRSDQENLLAATGNELEKLRTEITKKEQEINKLRQSSGIVGSADEAAAAQVAKIDKYDRALMEARNRRIELQSRMATGGTLLIADDPVRKSLEEDLRKAESELAKARSTLTAEHPTVLAAQRNVAALRAQLAAASGGSRNALKQQIDEAVRQESELVALEKQSRNQLEDIESHRQEENKLLTELARMQSQEDRWRREQLDQRVVARLAESGDVGIGARVIEKPAIPEKPVWPNKKVLLAAGSTLGLIAGFVLGLASLARQQRKQLEKC